MAIYSICLCIVQAASVYLYILYLYLYRIDGRNITQSSLIPLLKQQKLSYIIIGCCCCCCFSILFIIICIYCLFYFNENKTFEYSTMRVYCVTMLGWYSVCMAIGCGIDFIDKKEWINDARVVVWVDESPFQLEMWLCVCSLLYICDPFAYGRLTFYSIVEYSWFFIHSLQNIENIGWEHPLILLVCKTKAFDIVLRIPIKASSLPIFFL